MFTVALVVPMVEAIVAAATGIGLVETLLLVAVVVLMVRRSVEVLEVFCGRLTTCGGILTASVIMRSTAKCKHLLEDSHCI